MCLNNTLLMRLKVVLTKGQSTTKVGSSLHGGGVLLGGFRAPFPRPYSNPI
jgi:hypothetical protein